MYFCLGTSGCGKSSLLDILADRKDQRGLSGRVLLSGRPRSKTYKYSIGYVVQDGMKEKSIDTSSTYIYILSLKISSVEH